MSSEEFDYESEEEDSRWYNRIGGRIRAAVGSFIGGLVDGIGSLDEVRDGLGNIVEETEQEERHEVAGK